MLTPEEIVRRWKTNAGTLGIRLTDEDIDRIGSTGVLDRLTMIEAIIERTNANNIVPDYLADTRKQGSADE